MRAGLFLAAVAAGFLSVSSAAAEDSPAAAAKAGKAVPGGSAVVVAATSASGDSTPNADAAPQPTVVVPAVTSTSSEKSTASAPKAEAPKKPAVPTLVARIDLSSQTMTLHYSGKRQETWKISSGRDGYATPRGTYRPQWTARMWYSRKYDNAPMPHAVFFVGGVAVHGTQSTGLLGTPASHGCVRLSPGHASRFYALVHRHGLTRTRIEVIGRTPAARVAKRPERGQWRDASTSSRRSSRRTASDGRIIFGGRGVATAPRIRRYRNGLVYLPPNSPFRGRETFVYNGVVYRRVR
jgi:lipoprotein-anchoring transpeptidase ErfK/SrfK